MTEASSTDDVITLRIRFKSETLERFIERYGGDLGPDEVFVRTKEPLSIGTAIAFDFTLNDATPLINGRGRVAWTRLPGDPAGAPGMGVRIQSLSAASWQTLRKVLAGSGRSDAGVGASLLGRRSTPPGPAAAPAEDAERTEVARMPPSFFEQAFETAPRAPERPRPQGRQSTASFEAAPTPRGGVPLTEPQGGYERLDLDDIEDDVTVSSSDAAFTRRTTPSGLGPDPTAWPDRPERSMNQMPVPEPWPRSMTPAANRTSPGRPPAFGAAGPMAPAPDLGRTPGPIDPPPGWRSTSPRGGLEMTAPAGNPGLGTTAPMGQPALNQLVSSTSPTLPATGAIYYDPDNVESPPRQGEPMGTKPIPRHPTPPHHPPSDMGGFINDFDAAPRSGSGRIPQAISPEEMALAAAAVRGPGGEAPLWPGVLEEPPRTSTFKIWAALFLAASGVVGALLWLTPMLSKGRTPPVPQPVGMVEGPSAATPPGSSAETEHPAGELAPVAGTTPPPAPVPAPPPAAVVAAPPAPPPAAAPAAVPAAPPVAAAASKPAAPASAPIAEVAPARPRPRVVRKRRAPNEGTANETESPFADPAARPLGAASTPPSGAPGVTPPAGTSTAEAAAAAIAPPAAEPGAEDVYWLSVRSTPSGADVLIDGQVEGKTPFQRRIFDPARSYALVVRKAGFTSIERSVSGSSEWAKRGNVRTLAVTARLDAAPGATEAAPPPAAASPPAVAAPPSTSPPPPAPAPTSPPPVGRGNPFDEPTAPAPRP